MGNLAEEAGYDTDLCIRLTTYMTENELWAPGMLSYDRKYHCEFLVINVHPETRQLYVCEGLGSKEPYWRPMSDMMVATDDDLTGGELFGWLGAGWCARLDEDGVDVWDERLTGPPQIYRGSCLAEAVAKALLERE